MLQSRGWFAFANHDIFFLMEVFFASFAPSRFRVKPSCSSQPRPFSLSSAWVSWIWAVAPLSIWKNMSSPRAVWVTTTAA